MHCSIRIQTSYAPRPLEPVVAVSPFYRSIPTLAIAAVILVITRAAGAEGAPRSRGDSGVLRVVLPHASDGRTVPGGPPLQGVSSHSRNRLLRMTS